MLALPVAPVMTPVGRTPTPVRFAAKSSGASDEPVGLSSSQARIVVHATSMATASPFLIGASIYWMQRSRDVASADTFHPVMSVALVPIQPYERRTRRQPFTAQWRDSVLLRGHRDQTAAGC